MLPTRGTIHQAYRDGMEDQFDSLGLVLNSIVLRTTRYIDAAVAQLQTSPLYATLTRPSLIGAADLAACSIFAQ